MAATNQAVDLELTGAAASPPDANTLVKDNIVKGWIYFNGTGTIAINDSYNVASITDLGTGEYTVTWDTDFATTGYCVTGGTHQYHTIFPLTPATGSIKVQTYDSTPNLVDATHIYVNAIGDQ
jgi:hypothetical protein